MLRQIMTIDKKTELGYIGTNHWNVLVKMEIMIVLIEKLEVISIMNKSNEETMQINESNKFLMELFPFWNLRAINLN